MLCNKLVIAAFIALVHQVTAAPVDARNKPVKQPQGYVFKGNDHNVFVAGTAAGGGESLLLYSDCTPYQHYITLYTISPL